MVLKSTDFCPKTDDQCVLAAFYQVIFVFTNLKFLLVKQLIIHFDLFTEVQIVLS